MSILLAAQALSMHRGLVRAGFVVANTLSWIFVFQFSFVVAGSIEQAAFNTALLYGLAQIITALATPFAAAHVRNGTRRLMAWGIVCAAAAWVFLGMGFAGYASTYAPALIAAFAILLGLYRAVYWVPYTLAREVQQGALRGWLELLLTLVPAAAGYAIATRMLAPESVLAFAAGLALLSLIPLTRVADTYENFVWGYRETYGELFEPRHRRLVLLSFARGIEGAALLFLWPLLIFLLVGQSFLLFGAIMTLTLLLAGPVASLLAPLRPRPQEHPLLLQATLAGSVWIVRLIVGFPVAIVAADAYGMLFRSRTRDADLFTREQSADLGSYIDEYSALKEIALSLGRIFVVFAAAAILVFTSFYTAIVAAFLIAAAAAAIATFAGRGVALGEL